MKILRSKFLIIGRKATKKTANTGTKLISEIGIDLDCVKYLLRLLDNWKSLITKIEDVANNRIQ